MSTLQPDDTVTLSKWLQTFTKVDDIPQGALEISHARSSGPGGQNVNKVNSKVEVRFSVTLANWLPEYTKRNLLIQQKNRINKKGEIIFSSDSSRTQTQNLLECKQKLFGSIMAASYIPKETDQETKDRVAKLDKKFHEKRLEEKKRGKPKERKGDW